jgi:hypothetical protein
MEICSKPHGADSKMPPGLQLHVLQLDGMSHTRLEGFGMPVKPLPWNEYRRSISYKGALLSSSFALGLSN